jgi:hypothetical protein
MVSRPDDVYIVVTFYTQQFVPPQIGTRMWRNDDQHVSKAFGSTPLLIRPWVIFDRNDPLDDHLPCASVNVM